MDEKTFLTDMEELLELDAGALNCAVELAGTEVWDSLAFVSFLAMADSNYGVQVAPKELLECKTVGDLMQLLSKQKGQNGDGKNR